MSSRSASRPSLDGARSEAERYIAKLKKDGEIKKVRRAVRHAKQSACPHAKVVFQVYSTSTKKAYEIPCGSWTCSFCGWQKQKVAEYMVLSGMLDAHKRGEKVRFLTLTEDPQKPMKVADLSAAWNRLRTNLKDLDKLEEYAAVVEATSRGRPHLHVVFTGDYVPQRQLSKLAEKAGFGRVADIRLVDFDPNQQEEMKAASYIAKELSGYMSKSKSAAAGQLVAKRRRPVRASRGWYPGGMARAKRELLQTVWARTGFEPDEGDFFFVCALENGNLRIQGRTPNGEVFSMVDRADADGRVERSQVSRREEARKETSASSATHPRKRHKRRPEREKRAAPSSRRALSQHEWKRRTTRKSESDHRRGPPDTRETKAANTRSAE